MSALGPATFNHASSPTPARVARRTVLRWSAVAGGIGNGLWPARAATDSAAWASTLAQARGQTVYFNAWGGAPPINAYIQWAGDAVFAQSGVKVVHVKIADAAEVVKRVRNEKAASQREGSIDLVWINGANFLAMKREGLLFGPFANALPAFAYVDTHGKPTTALDFAEPVDGMEAPWGMAQLTFMVDAKRVPQPPLDLPALLEFAQRHPGRVSYPRPPDFHGTTFLKQLLLDLTPPTQREALYHHMVPEAFANTSAPLWRTLDAMHPHLWRNGKQFPTNAATQRQMMSDGELLWAMTFNPNEAASEIAAGRLSASTQSYQFTGGTIGNTHFLAIPFNARAAAAAQVFANFLLGPQAQARKADMAVWGDPTVLDTARLPTAQRLLFAHAPQPGQPLRSAPALPEPHGTWVRPLEEAWLRRYA